MVCATKNADHFKKRESDLSDPKATDDDPEHDIPALFPEIAVRSRRRDSGCAAWVVGGHWRRKSGGVR